MQYSDRKKKVERPLLSSYVLVYISESDRIKVFDVHGVVRFVFWLGKPAEVQNKEIETLKSSLSGVIKNISIKQLKKGSNYRIPEGPFKGIEGTVIDNAKNKLKLKLTSLGVLITLTLG